MRREQRQAFEQRMKGLCPLLFKDLYGNPKETAMSFGFDIGPGWYPLLEQLSLDLEMLIQPIYEKAIDDPETPCYGCGRKQQWHWFFFLFDSLKYFFINRWRAFKAFPLWIKRDKSLRVIGITKSFWRTLFYTLFKFKWYGACRRWEPSYPKATQVKEKFAGLRFYMTSYSDEIDELINEAEKKSFTICEECGKPGKVRGGNWLKCLCDKCEETRKGRR